MNDSSASPAEGLAPAAPAASAPRRTLIWDAPVRVFHWLAVLSFAGAYVTAESERWRLLHVTLGYTLAGLVAFRVIWGLVGTRHARFTNFVRGPATVLRYLKAMLAGRPEHHIGHNPAGALAIVAMLGLAAAVTASGWSLYQELGGDWLEEVHEFAANAMLAVVFVHVAGVVLASRLHRENLVAAMVDGRKAAPAADGIARAWRVVAAVMVVAVAAFWVQQWTSAPASGTAVSAKTGERQHHDDD